MLQHADESDVERVPAAAIGGHEDRVPVAEGLADSRTKAVVLGRPRSLSLACCG
jgi:hypothetical protein